MHANEGIEFVINMCDESTQGAQLSLCGFMKGPLLPVFQPLAI